MDDRIDVKTLNARLDDTLPQPLLVDSTDQLVNLSAAYLRVQLPAFADNENYDQVLLVLSDSSGRKQLHVETGLDAQGAQGEFYKHDLQALFEIDDEVRVTAYLHTRTSGQWVRIVDSEASQFC